MIQVSKQGIYLAVKETGSSQDLPTSFASASVLRATSSTLMLDPSEGTAPKAPRAMALRMLALMA